MDKRTLLAVVLSVVVISAGFMIQGLLAPDPVETATEQVTDDGQGVTAAETTETSETPQSTGTETQTLEATPSEPSVQTAARDTVTEERERTITIETDLFVATFTNKGGELDSLLLKEHFDDEEPINMVYAAETDWNGFFLSFGPAGTAPVDAIFEYSRRGEYGVEFRRDFIAPPDADGVSHPFTLVKRYNFEPGTYMFELIVSIENSVNQFPNLNFGGFAYTLGYGPQIGPEFESLGGRGEYRYYYTYSDGKRNNNRIRGNELVITDRFVWSGIVGKYFGLLAAPLGPYELTFSQPVITDGPPNSSFMYLSRPLIKSSTIEDRFLIYAGPKTRKQLATFNDPTENPFQVSDLNLDTAVDTSRLLGWLESILTFFLDLFYRLIPNYGVAIILLSIFIKLVFYPITRKSYDSTAKMQAINPKITELKERLKDKPQQMNQEMAALYKREGVNPLGGCLPIFIQMPIFIAFYGVLSKHFPLRGAPFFWWITDLSEPDSILRFGTEIPLLRWTDLRLLPIIYIGTQLLSSKMMQTPNTSTSKNMKMMQYFLPIFFFFILYNAPSGLLIYWTLTNVFTAIQQKATSAYRKTHEPKNKPGDDDKGGGFLARLLGGGGGPGPGTGRGPSKGTGTGPRKKR